METENKPEGGGLPPEIERAALMFVAGPLSQPDTLRYPHTRDGLLVATDGRALLRVEDPRIVAKPGSRASVLDFTPEDGDVLIGGPEKIDALRIRVAEAWCGGLERIDKLNDEFDEDTAAHTERCPCCGAEIYVDEDRDLVDLDDREDQRPSERNSSRYVRIQTPAREDAFSLFSLNRMLDAAKLLGGAAELRLGQHQLQLCGANWIALCIHMHGMPHYSAVALDLEFPEART